MKKYREHIFRSSLFMLLLVCLCLPALPVTAGSGIGLGSASIDIENAMRGSQYKNSITVFNTGDQSSDYVVTIDGEAASWVSLDYNGKPLESFSVPSNSKDSFGVTVTVPGDAANRKYSAQITVTSVPSSSGGGSGQGVSLAAYSIVSISVSGTQNISGKVSGITVIDQETGYPVGFKVFFENTGNVIVAPSVDIRVTWKGNVITNFNYNKTEVEPFKNSVIDITWDSTGQTPGDYSAQIAVNLDGKQIYANELSFKILALGALTRSGEFSDLSVTGTLQPGKLAKIYAVFSNTGQIDTWAEFNGEVYLKEALIEAVKSEKLLVKRGAKENLAAYFTPAQVGDYIVKGYVLFEGKKTEVLEKKVTIQAGAANVTTSPGSNTTAANNSTDEKKPFNMVIPVLIAIVILLGVIVFLLLRRRKG
jgi:hypothetical protein